MLLTDIETAVRQDLFDPAGGSQRWQNSDIDRAIDKAVDRYSQYYPNIAFADMAAQPFQRTYPYPQSWNTAYPVWWIERILFPLQAAGSTFAPPPTGMAGAAAAGSGLGVGAYQYALTFLTPGGETPSSPLLSVSTTSGNQQVNLSSIPLGPPTTSTPGERSTASAGAISIAARPEGVNSSCWRRWPITPPRATAIARQIAHSRTGQRHQRSIPAA